MGKAKKIIIGVVVTALVGTGIGGGLLYVRKGSQKEVLVASVSDLAGERYDSDATLSGTVYANATQRISVEKDMIIQEVYVSKGDEVKPGDKLISFDMTLVENGTEYCQAEASEAAAGSCCCKEKTCQPAKWRTDS